MNQYLSKIQNGYSFFFKCALLAASFGFMFSACGEPEVPPVEGLQWSKMSKDERFTFMGTKVYPTLKALFIKHDSARYEGKGADGFPKFKCDNCHGVDPGKRNYKMPNPDLLPLDPNNLPSKDSKVAHFKKYGIFMRGTVIPKMKELFATVNHPQAKTLFCFTCHTKADSPKEVPPTEQTPDAGSPEPSNPDADNPEPSKPELPSQKSYKNDILPLFTKYGCTPGCHGGSAGLSLGAGAYKNLVGVPSTTDPKIKRVTQDDATKSMLYLKVAAKVNGTQPPGGSPMPLNAKVLSSEDLATLKAWIDQGAQDN